ncbi:MAG: DUF2889 domain-containing protein [Eubacteriales bacterium]
MLFERDKSIKIRQVDEHSIEIVAHLKDNFHEIETTMVIDSRTRSILGARAEMITVPFDLCHEMCVKMNELAGLKIKKGIRKLVEGIVGGSWGCDHLVGLVMDSVKAAIQATDFCLLPAEMPFEEKLQKIQAINMGICHTYNSLHRKPRYIGSRDL